ncbi:MAG TPA: carbohydrate ABC transporter permease [Thermomicrobiales bacterium]|nr:carbohydrate ABC transporter permease [Thermomicrobiales bacterium]
MAATTPAIARAARRRRIARIIAAYAALTVVGLLFLLPFVWMVSTSVKPNDQVFVYPPQWIPKPILWNNYADAMTAVPFLRYFRNTLFISGMTVAGTLISCSLVAYGFSRVRWFGRDVVFLVVLATMMLPTATTLVPLYIIFRRLGWMGTFNPLIVPPFFGTAFFIFLLRQFFMTIPMELSDAAKIDGATELGILWRIILPLSKPALASVALFSFLWSWSDFFGPLIFLTDERLYTISLGLVQFQSRYDTAWGQVMAASTVFTVPVLVLFFVAQRQFIEGVTLTGIKG